MHDQTPMTTTKKQIYNYIADREDVSKAELIDQFKLTSSTLSRILDEMLTDKLLLTSGYGPSSGGRKPILYNINSDYRYIIGIEISRVYSVLGLFDMKLRPKTLIRWRMDSAMKPLVFLEHVQQQIYNLLKDYRIEIEQIYGIGIGAVGPLDRERGIFLDPQNYPAEGWSQLPITQLLRDQFQLPVWLDNGANCAIMGEQWAMRTQQEDAMHMLYVHVGAGIRSSMISGGQIVQGAFDREGAFGQMIVQAGALPIMEGSHSGALENYVSIPAIIEQVKRQVRLGRYLEHNGQVIDAKQIDFEILLSELRKPDSYVHEVFQQSATYLGIGVANLINIFQPEKVILGGALISAYKPYSDIVASVAQHHTYHFPAYQAQFQPAILNEDAVATGAALMARNKLLL